jgi:hypothetical protein
MMILYPFKIDIKSIFILACSSSPLTKILRHSLLIKHTKKKCRSDRSGLLLMTSEFGAKKVRNVVRKDWRDSQKYTDLSAI